MPKEGALDKELGIQIVEVGRIEEAIPYLIK